MAVGLDCGTGFFCKANLDEVDEAETSFTVERNVFAEVKENLEDPEDILRENNYSYVKFKDKLFVVGEDVYKIHNIESLFKKSGSQSYFSEVRRPMKNGLLNTAEDKMSIAIIQEIIKKLLGKPKYPGEVCCFCVPGEPVNSVNNVLFHKTILTSFIKSLGFTPECINEGMAIIFAECPTMDDPNEPDGVVKFSGLGISMGAGMSNVSLSFRQLPLLTFSIEGGGDYIDREAAKVAGCEHDIATITKYKEKKFSFKEPSDDIRHLALSVYYEALIKNMMSNFSAKFVKMDQKIDNALSIVVAGGTSLVPGFMEKFSEVLSGIDLPFKIKEIRHARAPLFSAATGCLIRALNVENKLKTKQ